MINREWQDVSVVSFTTAVDAYGQPRKTTASTRTVKMVLHIYSQQNVQDIRFNEVTEIGLTTDNDITDANQIICGNVKYNVLYVIPSSRLNQILMRKVDG